MRSILEAKHLYAGYGNKQVVTDFSFSLFEGELCGIIGTNGCGKTTLFRGILGSEVWMKGECTIFGKDILTMSPKRRAAEVALLPQLMEVPNGMLVEDILEIGFYPRLSLFGSLTKEMREQMKDGMEAVGITHLMGCYYHKLSEGQKQLVLLLRTLLQNTPVLFMDEPDSALDFVQKHQMFLRLRELVKKQQKAGLLVLHDPSIALTYCDRIFLMKEGCLVGEIQSNNEDVTQIQRKLQIIYDNILARRHPNGIQVWYEN